MKKSNKDKGSAPFEKKSHYNANRDDYVDDNGNYVYTTQVKVGGKWQRKVLAVIPFTEETADIIIALDQDNHDFDLDSRYDEENEDYSIRNQRNNHHGDPDDEDSFDGDPIENIADPRGDVFEQLYGEEPPVDPKVQMVEDFIKDRLTPEQQNLIYDHLGMHKTFEEIGNEGGADGKPVSKQAVHNRMKKIINKGRKEFGVDGEVKKKNQDE